VDDAAGALEYSFCRVGDPVSRVLADQRARMKQTGLPDGRLRYSDTGAWRKVEKPYFDGEWGLVGKPDYVIESRVR